MTPCEACDFIGPELPGIYRDNRELHRAAHDIGRALWVASQLDRLLDWLTRVLPKPRP